jgi:16S rRNA (cytosine967-C5)-methyltransferase
MNNTRRTVLDILLSLEKNGFRYDHSHKLEDLNERDRQYAERLIRVVTERRYELLDCLSQVSSLPPAKMKPAVRNILLMAISEIRWFDSVPDRAAVNEAVELSKRYVKNLSGFVNGVLRGYLRMKDKGEEPEPRTDEARYNMPSFVIDMWKSAYPDMDLDGIIPGGGDDATTVRVMRYIAGADDLLRSLQDEGILAEPAIIPSVSGTGETGKALILHNIHDISHLPEFRSGNMYVQDLSSMIPAEEAYSSWRECNKEKKELTAIDVCASPGGKSIDLAELLRMDPGIKKAEIIARDKSEKKTHLIKENINRLGLSDIIRTEVFDAGNFDPTLRDKADILIADLPCSGLGVVRHKSEIRNRIKKSDIISLSELQQNILKASIPYLKTGGIMVYSTCTVTPDENQNMRDFILEENKNFNLIKERQFFPDMDHDGFYVAVFKKI